MLFGTSVLYYKEGNSKYSNRVYVTNASCLVSIDNLVNLLLSFDRDW